MNGKVVVNPKTSAMKIFTKFDNGSEGYDPGK